MPADDRDELKRTIYQELSLRTGISLPWGSLTGIRPTGMVRKRIESGMSDEAVTNDMRSRYYISQEKLQLAMEIAKREIELMRPLSPEKNYSLYVDIPFCPTRCLYCSFTSNAVGRDRTKVEAYLGALKNWVNLCDEYDCFFGIMDLHSLTVRQNPTEFRQNARKLYALYVAAGLDPEKNCIYPIIFLDDWMTYIY